MRLLIIIIYILLMAVLLLKLIMATPLCRLPKVMFSTIRLSTPLKLRITTHFALPQEQFGRKKRNSTNQTLSRENKVCFPYTLIITILVTFFRLSVGVSLNNDSVKVSSRYGVLYTGPVFSQSSKPILFSAFFVR